MEELPGHRQESPENEIRILKLLKHPNIVRLIDGRIIEGKRAEAVLEYCPGPPSTTTEISDLFEYIYQSPNGRLSERAASLCISQLASALAHCHSHRIVHLDIALENILLTDDGNCKLADFGRSHQFSSSGDSLLEGRCGRLSYMAPEMYDGKRPYNGYAADLFSLGCVCYAMLVGAPLWKMPDLRDEHFVWTTSEGRSVRDRHELRRLSPCAVSLLAGLLTIDPARRMTISELLAHPFLGFHGRE